VQTERERIREQDQREKEELEERLREKDAASTKKVNGAIRHLWIKDRPVRFSFRIMWYTGPLNISYH
jgi:hypothetical protein